MSTSKSQSGLLALLILLATASSSHAQGWGMGQKGKTSGSGKPGRYTPTIRSGGNSGRASSLSWTTNSPASQTAASSWLRANKNLRGFEIGGQPKHHSVPSAIGSGNSTVVKNHGQSLTVGIGVGGGAGGGVGKECHPYKNPFCRTEPLCPPGWYEILPAERAYTAVDYVELARQAFRRQDYPSVLRYVELAIEQPQEVPDRHQLLSLVLFAQGDYLRAAAAAHAALSQGPGWNWNTLYGLYGNVDIYTRHLRSLEAAVSANPNSAEHHFLLGYHCLMLNQVDSGRRNLSRALELQPGDALITSLLGILPPATAAAE
jgi:hypothetical protein